MSMFSAPPRLSKAQGGMSAPLTSGERYHQATAQETAVRQCRRSGATMTESAPKIDYANLPNPAEVFLATLFITVRKVARSRDFYSRVLGGTVVLEENPCMVKLSNSWIIMNPGGPPTPDKPGITVVDYQPRGTTSIFLKPRAAGDRPAGARRQPGPARAGREARLTVPHLGPGRAGTSRQRRRGPAR